MEDVRKRLLGTFDALPEHRRTKVLDFAEFLQRREQVVQAASASPRDPEKDPLLEFAGGPPTERWRMS